MVGQFCPAGHLTLCSHRRVCHQEFVLGGNHRNRAVRRFGRDWLGAPQGWREVIGTAALSADGGTQAGWKTSPVAAVVLASCAFSRLPSTVPGVRRRPRAQSPKGQLGCVEYACLARILGVLTVVRDGLKLPFCGPLADSLRTREPKDGSARRVHGRVIFLAHGRNEPILELLKVNRVRERSRGCVLG